MKYVMRLSSVAFVVAISFIVFGCASSTYTSESDTIEISKTIPDTTISAPGGSVSFSQLQVKIKGENAFGSYFAKEGAINGAVTNQSDATISHVQFNLGAYSSSEVELASESIYVIEEIAPGETVRLAGTNNGGSLMSLSNSLKGEEPDYFAINDISASFPVEYSFTLVEPDTSENVAFSDEQVEIQFGISKSEIGFQLKNTGDAPVRVLWDEISIVDPSGNSHRIMHNGVKYSERNNPQSPTVVPPDAKISDVLQPTDLVEYSETLNEWVSEPLFPSGQNAFRLEGSGFSVFMPMEIGDQKENYNFKFKVSDVSYR